MNLSVANNYRIIPRQIFCLFCYVLRKMTTLLHSGEVYQGLASVSPLLYDKVPDTPLHYAYHVGHDKGNNIGNIFVSTHNRAKEHLTLNQGVLSSNLRWCTKRRPQYQALTVFFYVCDLIEKTSQFLHIYTEEKENQQEIFSIHLRAISTASSEA